MNSCVRPITDLLIQLTRPQSGLHSEACEIEYNLHPIVAGRKRSMLQSIQEETATNIYLPSPLQGLVGPDLLNPASPSSALRNNNVIWITGEFFGVQRARDMLLQVAATKVGWKFTCFSGDRHSPGRSPSSRAILPSFLASWIGWSPTALRI